MPNIERWEKLSLSCTVWGLFRGKGEGGGVSWGSFPVFLPISWALFLVNAYLIFVFSSLSFFLILQDYRMATTGNKNINAKLVSIFTWCKSWCVFDLILKKFNSFVDKWDANCDVDITSFSRSLFAFGLVWCQFRYLSGLILKNLFSSSQFRFKFWYLVWFDSQEFCSGVTINLITNSDAAQTWISGILIWWCISFWWKFCCESVLIHMGYVCVEQYFLRSVWYGFAFILGYFKQIVL